MSEIDPVILQLRVDMNTYLSQLRSTTRTVDKLLGAQEAKARHLEAEMKRSSGAIAGHMRSIAGAIGAAFGARELAGLADSYTRLQNNLRVAGVEGENLKAVQDRLFESAQKYGTSIEGLSSLFSGLSQISKDLGASQEDLFLLTDATSQSLKITGINAEQAGGAMLGLKQVLGAARIGTDDFNQVVEGGLLPLVQAAANSEKFGGSVNKLKTYIKDTGMSGREFFDLIKQGAGELEGKAAKATLTLAGGFTSLGNAITIYFGEADKANGVSAALGAAMGALAANLDIIIPALAAIAIGMGARYVSAAVAASAATGALSAATFALQARMAGAATSAEALSFALNGLRINPIGLAVTALAAGFAYVALTSKDAAQAVDQNATATGSAARFQELLNDELRNDPSAQNAKNNNALAAAHRNAAKAAYEHAAAEVANRRAQAQTELELARQGKERVSRGRGGSSIEDISSFDSRSSGRGKGLFVRTKQIAVEQADRESAALQKAYQKALANPPTIPTATGGAPNAAKRGGGGAGPSGPSLAEISERFAAQMEQLSQQMLSAEESLAQTAEARASFAMQALAQEQASQQREVETDKYYSKAQKDALIAQIGRAADTERARIEFAKAAQLEQEAAQKAQEQFNAARDALQVQYDMADTQDQRRTIALEMVDAELKYLKSVQDAIIASGTATAAEKERARIIRDSIGATASGRMAAASRQNEGPLASWTRQNGAGYDTQARAEEAVVAELERVRSGIHGALSDAIGVDDPLISYLLDTLLQEVLFKPIAAALSQSGGGGGGGGGVGSIIATVGSALFGRASGGRVNPGQTYRVNEAASPGNVEMFRPDVGGQIIPLGRTNAVAAASQGQGAAVVRVELSGDIDARIEQVSGPIAIQVVRASAPSLIDASANETMRRSQRPRI